MFVNIIILPDPILEVKPESHYVARSPTIELRAHLSGILWITNLLISS